MLYLASWLLAYRRRRVLIDHLFLIELMLYLSSSLIVSSVITVPDNQIFPPDHLFLILFLFLKVSFQLSLCALVTLKFESLLVSNLLKPL